MADIIFKHIISNRSLMSYVLNWLRREERWAELFLTLCVVFAAAYGVSAYSLQAVAQQYPTPKQPAGIAGADLNGDGKLDLAVANYDSNNIAVFINNGDGTFRKSDAYPVGAHPHGIFCGDLRGTGHADLAVVNSGTSVSYGSVTVFFGNDDGTFTHSATYAIPALGLAAITGGNLRGNGMTDLVVTSATYDEVFVLRNNGNGTFAQPVGYPLGVHSSPHGVVLLDEENDGRASVATANYGTDNIAILSNDGAGGLRPPTLVPVGHHPISLAAADLNNDGLTDLVTANAGDNTVSVVLSSETGTFLPSIAYSSKGVTPYFVTTAVLNEENRGDIVVANYSTHSLAVLLNKGDGTFDPASEHYSKVYRSTISEPVALFAGDFGAPGADGQDGVALANFGNNTLSVFLPPATASSTPTPFDGGHTWYMSQGDPADDDDGTAAKPWHTLAEASAGAKPGDVVLIHGGTYTGADAITASGTLEKPITFASVANESPLFTNSQKNDEPDTISVYGSYITLEGIRATNQHRPGQAIWVDYQAHDVTITHDEVFGAQGQGVLISGNHNLLEKCNIHDNGYHANQDHGVYIEGQDNLIRANIIHDNWANGLQLNNSYPNAHTGHNRVEDNYVYHNGYGAAAAMPDPEVGGIVLAVGHAHDVVRHNRSCDNAQYGFKVFDNELDNVFSENISCYNRGGGFNLNLAGPQSMFLDNISFEDANFAVSLSGAVNSNSNVYYNSHGDAALVWGDQTFNTLNDWQGATGLDSDSTTTDPLFTNLPADAFNSAQAGSYGFCNKVKPAWCK